jgi:uncharacterized protein YukE
MFFVIDQRGGMERIKIDTDLLKEKSKVFETSAGVYAQAGSELLSFVAGLPSYDGQLSGPARATALEVNRQCQELYDCYLNDAKSLVKTAQAFEDVDNSVIKNMNDLTNILVEFENKIETGVGNIAGGIPGFIEGLVIGATGSLLIGMGGEQIVVDKVKEIINGELDDHIRGGSSSIGYDYDPLTKTLKIWWKGEMKTYTNLGPSDTWPEDLRDFKDAVNGVDDAKKELLGAEFGNILAMGYDITALIFPPAFEGAMATSITAIGADVGTMYNLVEKELNLRKAILELKTDS